jgi:hypothetical protein
MSYLILLPSNYIDSTDTYWITIPSLTPHKKLNMQTLYITGTLRILRCPTTNYAIAVPFQTVKTFVATSPAT